MRVCGAAGWLSLVAEVAHPHTTQSDVLWRLAYVQSNDIDVSPGKHTDKSIVSLFFGG